MKFALRASALAVAACLAAPAQADFSISPRFFLYFDNSNQRSSGFAEATNVAGQADADLSDQLSDFYGTPIDVETHGITSAGINNQDVYRLFGGAFTAGLDPENRTQLTFSALYGVANSDIRAVQTFEQDISVLGLTAHDLITQHMEGRNKTKRLDLELTAQHRLNERFALIGGIRYEHLDGKASGDYRWISSSNALNVFSVLFGDSSLLIDLQDAEGTFTTKAKSNIFSARAGAAAFVNIDQRNLVYLNGLAHVTYEPDIKSKFHLLIPDEGIDQNETIKNEGETAIGPDITVGYTHKFTDTIGIDVRYRAIVYFPISGPRSFDDPRVNHGINAGLTFNF
jgi:hypothetical protein